MNGQFLGQILQVAFNYAPKSWQPCAAQLLPIAQNQALFAILGTTYGGNGVQSFALPDLRGRVAIHWGQGPGLSGYVIGEASGSQQVTMLASNLPQHNHTFNVVNAAPTQVGPGGNALAQGGIVGGVAASMYGAGAGVTMNQGTIAFAGNSQPIAILQPYSVLQYCIALNGIFPSRN